MNTIATTPRGNFITRAIRRIWLGYRITMLERDVEFYNAQADLMPRYAREYERVAAQLRIERALLED